MCSKHEASDFHKQAVDAMSDKADVGEMLSSQLVREKQANREYLLKVMSTTRYLARQALALACSRTAVTATVCRKCKHPVLNELINEIINHTSMNI